MLKQESKSKFTDLLEKLEQSSVLINDTSYIELTDAKKLVEQIIKRHYNILFDHISDILRTPSNTDDCETCNEQMVKAVNMAANLVTNSKD